MTDHERARAIFEEIRNSESIKDDFECKLARYFSSNVTAEEGGLGCRGTGDFIIHRLIATLAGNGNENTELDSRAQDDAGIVSVSLGGNKGYVVAAVDGMHSRLSSFPFLAGFHVARASIRDVMVKGARPIALVSDIHIANDGDVSKVFDYTAGIAAVADLSNVPLISGSTLRIGGDMVLGDRLTGCVGAVGFCTKILPRRATKEGDVLLMTDGSGGGTITTAALYYGYEGIIKETLNLDFIKSANVALDIIEGRMFDGKYANMIHSMTDVTNGGLRGDAREIAQSSGCDIILYEDKIMKTINKKVLQMLVELDIDPLGVSTDSLLLLIDDRCAKALTNAFEKNGVHCEVVGKVLSTSARAGNTHKGLRRDARDEFVSTKREPLVFVEKGGKREILRPHYRESPYTPIKKVASRKKPSDEEMRAIEARLKHAASKSADKKETVKAWIIANSWSRMKKRD